MSSKNVNRYDSTEYLKAYKDRGEFPRIHDTMFAQVRDWGVRSSSVDLCCSIGLLGQRLIDTLGMRCVGVEGYVISSREGPSFGVSMRIYETRFPEGLDVLVKAIEENEVQTLVARRCISELWTPQDSPYGDQFVRSIKAAGVRNVFLQGRQVTSRSTDPMATVQNEAFAFKNHFPVLEEDINFCILSLDSLEKKDRQLDVQPKTVMKTWGAF